MLLWDLEVGLKEQLREIPSAQRLPLAMRIMDWTLQSIGPIEVEVVRDWIEGGMQAGREAVRTESEKITLPEEVLDAYTEVDDKAYEPGVSHLLSALLACADAPEGLTPEVLSGVFSFCYEGLLDREDLPGLSIEEERQNAKCQETISFQKRCISDALGR